MTSEFWNYTIWYIFLGVFCLIQMLFMLLKAKNRKHALALYIIISGMTFTFEVTIFCFLKAYYYYPMILPHSSIDDGLAGNLFSQFTVTATALLIAVLNLKFNWFLIFSLIYGLIEELFKALGIYSQYWYKTWMTMLGLLLLFWITKKFYALNFSKIKPIWRYILLLFGLYTMHMPTIFWTLIISGIIALNTNILPDAMNSYALISLVNLSLLSFTCTFIYFSNIRWIWKSIIVSALYSILYFACRFDLIYVRDDLFLIFATIDIFGMLLCVFILDKLMVGDQP